MSIHSSATRIVVSHPDFRLLVRDALDNNDETTLVVPALTTRSVVYARLLVDEGAQLVEHAVAFIEAEQPELLSVVAKSLSAARPTRVSFIRLSPDGHEIIASSANQLSQAQIAACAASLLERNKASYADAEGPWTLTFAQGTFVGSLLIRQMGRMFEVSWDNNACSWVSPSRSGA